VGLSACEISTRLSREGTPLGRTAVSDILREEGFGRLLRGPEPEASISPATSGRDTRLPAAAVTDFATLPRRAHTTMAGLLLTVPDLVALDLPAMVTAAGYPGTRTIPAAGYLLSLLALKLTATRRVSLTRQISALTSKDFKQITLDRPGRHNRPHVHESAAVKLTSYPGTVRQLVVTGLGRDAPTVIITNDHEITTKALIEQYARRMTIEQRLAEIIQAFCADALSSAVNLNVDLDVVLCVLAQALTAAFRLRLPGNYDHATPDTLQRRFLDTPGEIISNDDNITVKINRRAYSPVLRHADLPADTIVPWWGGRQLHFEFA